VESTICVADDVGDDMTSTNQSYAPTMKDDWPTRDTRESCEMIRVKIR